MLDGSQVGCLARPCVACVTCRQPLDECCIVVLPAACTMRTQHGQVVVALAGNVTFGAGVDMRCPVGTNFQDTFGGLYDGGAFTVQTTACSNSAVNSLVLASSLQFVCNRSVRDRVLVHVCVQLS